MFYSGWNFPSPRRMALSGSYQSANCHVQDTGSPGISLLKFFPSAGQGTGRPARRGADSSERIHIRSDLPIHPHSGVFYFEVEVRGVGSGPAAGGSGSGSGGAAGEPALVIGVCRGTLPLHKLPGEEAHGVGLFTAQRMVYANGKSEGEAVRLSTGQRRAKGMQVDDAVGCIVNLMDGTVRFTCNGEVLGVVSPLSRRMPRHGYFPAVGVLRFTPALSLRVVLQPLGRAAVGAAVARSPLPDMPPTQPEASTASAGYFVFDVDRYCEQIADAFVKGHRQQMYRRGVGSAAGWEDDGREDAEGFQRKEKDDNEGKSREGCKCHDGNIITAIRKHLASRGMTKALSAFEKEQAELQCSRSVSGGHAGNGRERNKSSLSTHGSSSLLPTKSTGAAETSHRSCKSSNNKTLDLDKDKEGKNEATDESRNIAYSAHIRRLRDDISCGDMLSSTRRILDEGVLSPLTRNKICSAVERAHELSPNFWGLIFFAQRCDILFLLRAAHVIEVALSTMRKSLCDLQHLFRSDDIPRDGRTASNHSGGNKAESERGNSNNNSSSNGSKARKVAESGASADDGAVGACPVSPSVDIMELAFRALLEPFEELSLAARRHRRATVAASGAGERTFEAVAFGLQDGEAEAGGEAGEGERERGGGARWPCEDLAAHLFSAGAGAWADPAAPVTLLVRRSVPCIPPPRPAQQRAIVQAIAVLVAHLHAVRAHVAESARRGAGAQDWVDEWVALIDAARAQHRARCWRLLLHAVEDFNGAIEYRLLVWLRRHQQGSRGAEGCANHKSGRCGWRLFPSLRAAWRNVHASAALEPLLHVITRAFSEKLHRAASTAHVAATATDMGSAVPPSAPAAGGRKRGLSVAFDLSKSGVDEMDETDEPTAIGGGNPEDSNLCYADDIRLSCLYMKNIYNAVFA